MRDLLFPATLMMCLLASRASAQDDSQKVDRTAYASREIAKDPSAAPCAPTERSLTLVKGSLYRWAGGPGHVYSGYVLATKDGALVVDAAGTCNAEWLRDEIKTRFNVPVKYVILSEPHFDHIGGTQVFQEAGASAIAQKNSLEPIIGDKLPAAVPDRVFTNKATLTLGGETVELYHLGPSYSNAQTMVYFPGYKAIQCTDVCTAGRAVPYNDLPDFYYEGYVDTLDWVIKLNPEFINAGHGMGTTEDQVAARAYMIKLHDQVLALIRKGEDWDQLYRDVKFTDEEKQYRNYAANHILNVLGMYRYVSEHHHGLY